MPLQPVFEQFLNSFESFLPQISAFNGHKSGANGSFLALRPIERERKEQGGPAVHRCRSSIRASLREGTRMLVLF